MADSAAPFLPPSSSNTTAQDHSQPASIPLLEKHLQSFELHFDVTRPGQQAQPPLRFRVRRHWPVWTNGVATARLTINQRGALSYPGHPVFLGQWTQSGLPIFRDSLTYVSWHGRLDDLIDGHWATDPTTVTTGDGGVQARHFQQCMAELAKTSFHKAAGKDVHSFRFSGEGNVGGGTVDDTAILCLVTDKDAAVMPYGWRHCEVPKPAEERIIRMPWKWIKTEDWKMCW